MAEAKQTATAPVAINRLEHFPISFFAVVMGLLGLTLATHAAETRFKLGALASHAVLTFTVVVFAAITLTYLVKALRYPAAVRHEWQHPVRIAFFPAFSISLLLLSVALLATHKGLAEMVWMAGTAIQGVLMLSVVSNWIGHRSFQPIHLSPAWFIPAVGNVIVPVAGAQLGHSEISWLFFSAGMVFWIVLLTLVINRLVFHDPLPARLLPTLVILIAPPAVAFVAYYRLTGIIDPFARILISAGYVFALIVLTQVPRLRGLPFALSFWALSFPVAALSIASFLYASAIQSPSHAAIGVGLLGLLVVIIVTLIVRTLLAMRVGQVCVPE